MGWAQGHWLCDSKMVSQPQAELIRQLVTFHYVLRLVVWSAQQFQEGVEVRQRQVGLGALAVIPQHSPKQASNTQPLSR